MRNKQETGADAQRDAIRKAEFVRNSEHFEALIGEYQRHYTLAYRRLRWSIVILSLMILASFALASYPFFVHIPNAEVVIALGTYATTIFAIIGYLSIEKTAFAFRKCRHTLDSSMKLCRHVNDLRQVIEQDRK
jgi:hypothetical protein